MCDCGPCRGDGPPVSYCCASCYASLWRLEQRRTEAVRALLDEWATDDSAAGWMKERLYEALDAG